MIAAFPDKTVLHVIKWTGRVRLHAGVVTYCEAEHDASEGVLQVPDNVFTTGSSFQVNGTTYKACARCRMAAFASVS